MKQPIHSLTAALSATLMLSSVAVRADNWPHWRGPQFNGSSAEKNFPTEFSKTNNVKWVAELPGPAAATPIVWGDHVFVSSTDAKAKSLRALALDRKTGKELWNHEVSPAFSHDNLSNYGSPSPVTDGRLVYFYYGNGELVAFDFAGKKVWSRNLQQDYGQFAYQWTYGSSPTLTDGKLILQVLQRDVPVNGRGRKDGPNDSYLLALDPATGKELWRHVRPSEAHAESKESYATPIPVTLEGKPRVLIAGGDSISMHDLAHAGAELWRWGGYNPTRIGHWRLVPSPVANATVALVCAPKGDPVYAVPLVSQGNVPDSGLAWTSSDREVSSDVCTPLLYEGKFYVLNGERATKTLARIDPATGKAEWIGEIPGRAKIECSPTGADGKIYFQNFRGEVFVVAADKEFKVLHTTQLADAGEDRLRSTIVPAQGNLFIRTDRKLYCIGR